MKIILLTSSLGSGGAERVASTLANAWVARGDNVTLVPTFSGGGECFYKLSDEVNLCFLSDRVGKQSIGKKRYFARFFSLRNLILENKPDVVISFLPNVNIAAILTTFGTRLPVIICERSDPTQQPIGWLMRFACQVFYRFGDCLTVQTHEVEASIRTIYGGLKNIAVLPNPIPNQLASWRAGVSHGNGRRVLLSMGRLAPVKRVDRIIRAFAMVRTDFPEWELHIYGDGPLLCKLQKQVEELYLTGCVFFMGRTSNPWAAMEQADAFVMASEYEGFPNTLLEAMAVGLPCLATDCPSGPREITRNGENALLVDPEDVTAFQIGLWRLLQHEKFRTSMGARARKSVLGRYSLAAVLKRWDSVFTSIGLNR